MPDVDVDTLAVCLQALDRALRLNTLLAGSQTVDPADCDEIELMFEKALQRLARLYREEEKKGRVSIPLAQLVKRDLRDT